MLPVAPVLQVTFPIQPLAVSVAFSPSQQISLLVEIVGATGVVPFVTTIEFDTSLEHSPTLQVAVYVPSVLTVNELPVANVDHTIVPPVQAVAVSFTEPVSQIVVGPSTLIVGSAGFGFTSTVTVPVTVH